MNRDKLRIVNKIFNDDTIRAVWDSEVEKYYVSVVGVIAALTRSKNPRHYWTVLKERLA